MQVQMDFTVSAATKVNVEHGGIGTLHDDLLLLTNGSVYVEDCITDQRADSLCQSLQYRRLASLHTGTDSGSTDLVFRNLPINIHLQRIKPGRYRAARSNYNIPHEAHGMELRKQCSFKPLLVAFHHGTEPERRLEKALEGP